jgi:ribonuclease HI
LTILSQRVPPNNNGDSRDGPNAESLRLVQINLKHSKCASENLLIFLNFNKIDVALIQEPWVNNGKVKGLFSREFNLFYLPSDLIGYNPRTCILVKKNINAFLFPNFSDGDTTTISIEGVSHTMLSSVYLAHDSNIPTAALDSLVRTKLTWIAGIDANARHTIWGSKEINPRGESLLDYIICNDITICNRGNTPTFEFPSSDIYPGWKEVLDITISSNSVGLEVRNWYVSKENSFSDHKLICFDFNFQKSKEIPYRNPRKTDWVKFKSVVYNKLKRVSLSEDIDGTVDALTKTFDTAFKASCRVVKESKCKYPSYFDDKLVKLRKEVRKQFNSSYRSGDWSTYKTLLREYNKARRTAKHSEWVKFCEEIETVKDTGRLRKLLSKSYAPPSNIQLEDGSWAQSTEETNKILLSTHFPGCLDGLGRREEALTEYTEHSADFITYEKVIWAINSFSPFKSPGMDGIIPKMLQVTAKRVAPLLVSIYKLCIESNTVPERWKQVRVIFIPKAGKINHSKAKDYRPISLSSMLLKVLERVIDEFIRSHFGESIISGKQHAYIKGRSTETALHEVVRVIETSLEHSQYTLGAFLDIEGAFNNVNIEAIEVSLEKIGINQVVRRWISSMLKNRAIHSTIGGSSLVRYTVRGTPQGGVLSPLLWLLVINEVLLKLEADRFNVVAYADDVVILCSGLFPSTISDRVNKALRLVEKWANSNGLGVNPDKTELVLFTGKRKTPPFNTPSIGGKKLILSNEAKYLGVILDSKLNWSSNLTARINKAKTAFYLCRGAMGKSWGLSAKLTHWILTAIVRPILMYGVVVWWPKTKVKEHCKKLDGVIRCVGIGITGASRTTPTDVLLTLLAIPSSDVYAKYLAANAAVRLITMGYWKAKTYGHSQILDVLKIKPTNMDKCNKINDFSKNYTVSIPPRSFWSTENPLDEYDIKVFTDGSKTADGCGSGYYIQNTIFRQSFRLPNHCTVFQSEIFAILMACETLLKHNEDDLLAVTDSSIVICVDSQAAIKAIESVSTTSSLVRDCKRSICTLGNKCNLNIIWVPSHVNIQGNEIADTLARQGSDLHISWSVRIPVPTAFYKNEINSYLLERAKFNWQKAMHKSKNLWTAFNPKATRSMLDKGRKYARKVTFLLTGHWNIGRHARRLGIGNIACPGCGICAQETDLEHVWCLCPALTRNRLNYLGNHSFSDLEELKEVSLENKLAFINRVKWF